MLPRRQRDTARSKGEAALAAGEAGAAAQHFSKAVGVTHDMAFELIKVIISAMEQALSHNVLDELNEILQLEPHRPKSCP